MRITVTGDERSQYVQNQQRVQINLYEFNNTSKINHNSRYFVENGEVRMKQLKCNLSETPNSYSAKNAEQELYKAR